MLVYKVCRVVDGVFRSFSTKEHGFDLVYNVNEYTIPEHGPVWVFMTIDAAIVFAQTYMDESKYVLLCGDADIIGMKQPVFSYWSPLREYYDGLSGSGFVPSADYYHIASRFMPIDVICELGVWL